jgi:hypothetical protein
MEIHPCSLAKEEEKDNPLYKYTCSRASPVTLKSWWEDNPLYLGKN